MREKIGGRAPAASVGERQGWHWVRGDRRQLVEGHQRDYAVAMQGGELQMKERNGTSLVVIPYTSSAACYCTPDHKHLVPSHTHFPRHTPKSEARWPHLHNQYVTERMGGHLLPGLQPAVAPARRHCPRRCAGTVNTAGIIQGVCAGGGGEDEG